MSGKESKVIGVIKIFEKFVPIGILVFRKKCTYGDFDEKFQKSVRRLGVKILSKTETYISRREIQRLDLHQGGKNGRFFPPNTFLPIFS